jgi:putative transposase
VAVTELSVQEDHVHLVCSIPPKLSVSQFMGLLKGKLAIKLFKSYPKLRTKPYWGNHFWARGYFVTTVGIDEEVIRRYVRHQEDKERREEKERTSYDIFSEPPPEKP